VLGARFGAVDVRDTDGMPREIDGLERETEGLERAMDGAERDIEGPDREYDGPALRDGPELRAELPIDRPPPEDRPAEADRPEDPPRPLDWAKTSDSAAPTNARTNAAKTDFSCRPAESISKPPYHPQQFFHPANSCAMINNIGWSHRKQVKNHGTCFNTK